MNKQSLKYLKNEIIEDVTTKRIREYEAKAGVTVANGPTTGPTSAAETRAAIPGIKFGLAFCEVFGKCLVRWSGTDPAMIEWASPFADRGPLNDCEADAQRL